MTSWKSIALKSVPDPQQHMYVVASIVAGVMTAGATTVISGSLLSVLGLFYTYRRGEKAAKFEEAIELHKLIAPALKKDELNDYVAQFGVAKAIAEIKWAEENNYPCSDCAIELLESSQLDSPAEPVTASPPIAINSNSVLPQSSPPIAPPLRAPLLSFPVDKIDQHRMTQSTSTLPAPQQEVDLVQRIIDKPEHLLGIGASESGKGILFSNMAVALKAKRDCVLIVIDPKGDPNETTFFDNTADRVHRFRASKLTPDQIISEVKQAWEIVEEEFDKWAGIKPVYVFIDEMVFIGIQFSQRRDNFLNDKIAAIVTMGKSLGQFVWIATQYPGIEELGIKGGVAAQMSKILIGRNTQIEMLEGWRGYKLTKDIDFRAATAPMRKSPVDRAIWFKGDWVPMPVMPILSGYCRETGRHLNPAAPTTVQIDDTQLQIEPSISDEIAEALALNIAAESPSRRVAAEVGTSAGFEDIPQPPSRLGDELATSILEYFRCAVVQQPKKLTDIKGASRFKSSAVADEDLLQTLSVLVAAEQLESPMSGFWRSPLWNVPS